MNYTQRTKKILSSLNTHPRKRLSQNFMVNENLLDFLTHKIQMTPQTKVILEIGPGIGFLTEKLNGLEVDVCAVEKDKRFCTYLNDFFKNSKNVSIFEGDILEFEIEKNIPNISQKEIVCAGNIPYQISSPILDFLLQNKKFFSQVILTTQREFAERLVAIPGQRDSNLLSCWMQMHSEITILKHVSKGSFYPAPDVESSVIELKFFDESKYPKDLEELLRLILEATFQKRRKQILPSLIKSSLGFKKALLEKVLEDLSIDYKSRPENLRIDQWIGLAQAIDKEKSALK